MCLKCVIVLCIHKLNLNLSNAEQLNLVNAKIWSNLNQINQMNENSENEIVTVCRRNNNRNTITIMVSHVTMDYCEMYTYCFSMIIIRNLIQIKTADPFIWCKKRNVPTISLYKIAFEIPNNSLADHPHALIIRRFQCKKCKKANNYFGISSGQV